MSESPDARPHPPVLAPGLQPAGAVLRASLRQLQAQPVQTLLAVLGIALGVALATGIDLANGSATRAFSYATEGVAGRSTHAVVAGEGGLADSLVAHLRVRHGLGPAAPIVERAVAGLVKRASGDTAQPELSGGDSLRVTLRLLGIDPLSEAPFRPYLGEAADEDAAQDAPGGAQGRTPDPFPLAAVLTQPRAAALGRSTARELGLALGDSLTLEIEGRLARVGLVALLEPADALARRGLEGLVVVDVATAQELTGLQGRLTRIDLQLVGADSSQGLPSAAAVGRVLPPQVRLERAAARTERLEQMTRAFRLNLRALSLLALVVAALLIYNTTQFAVLRRRRWMGLMRALGVGRRALVAQVLIEAAVVGLLGAALGLGLGVWLAQVLTGLIARTVNDLYFAVQVGDVALEPTALLVGLSLGVAAAVGGALVPALEAAQVSPRGALLRSAAERRPWGPRLAVALGLAAAGAALLALDGGLATAYVALLLLIASVALLTPAAVVGLMWALGPVAGRLFGVLGRLAARDVAAALSRTGVAVAALAVAVAATIGVGVMVTSFRTTVTTWLGAVLEADVFVSAPATVARFNDGTLDAAVLARVAAHPGVETVGRIRSRELLSEGRSFTLVASAVPARTRARYAFAQGDAGAWARFDAGEAFVSEPFARRFGLNAGDSVTLPLDRGPLRRRVAAVYYDYGSDLGLVLLHERIYRAHSSDTGVSGLAIYARPGVGADSLAAQLRAGLAAAPDVQQRLFVRSNRALLAASLEVFDRTFAVTDALWLLTVLVAFVGVLSALLALEIERGRELAVLRAGGLTPGQLFGLLGAHTGLLGLAAGLIAVPVGLGLAWALVNVINLRSFGWTLRFEVPAGLLVQAVAFAVGAAVLAGLWPAWRMGRAPVALALRDE